MGKISIDEFIRLRNKSWQSQYRPLVDYIGTNYYSNLKNVKNDLEKLEQIRRNVSRWILKATVDEADMIYGKGAKEFGDWLKEVRNDLENDIQRYHDQTKEKNL